MTPPETRGRRLTVPNLGMFGTTTICSVIDQSAASGDPRFRQDPRGVACGG